MATSRETLPATFPTEEKAARWASFLIHPSIVQSETRLVRNRESGRWQVQIRRRSQEQAAEVNELI